jgi:hypothetical protein
MITITDKEKQYLLSVDAKQFVEGLYSKSIFYELLRAESLLTNKDAVLYNFNIVTVIGLYNLIVNIINSNVEEALNLRHPNNGIRITVYNGLIITFSIKPKDKSWQFNPNSHFQKDYEYVLQTTNMIPLNPFHPALVSYVIKDCLVLKDVLNVSHKFNFYIQDKSEFINKMLILYQDFADNIPI